MWGSRFLSRTFLTAAAGAVLIGSGCIRAAQEAVTPASEAPGAPFPEAPIRTDSSLYHVQSVGDVHEVRIGLTYTNPIARTVYIPACRGPNPPILEKRVRGEWMPAYDPPVLLCIGPPVVIEPGESFDYSYEIAGALPGSDRHPQLHVTEISGTYRLQWGILRDWSPEGPGLGKLLRLEDRVSEPFELRPAP